jgi:hypothetical protein
MTRRGVIGLLSVGVALASLGGCGLLGDDARWRLRMTVEVATRQGVKRGSGVVEMFAVSRIAFGTQSDARYTAGLSKGEAIVIDLPDGPLFMLLKDGSGSGDFEGPIFDALNGGLGLSNDDMMTFAKKMGGWFGPYKADLPRTAWPMMVRFRDINDPKTVERVDPAAISVTRIALETTADAVTTGIEKRFPPWFAHLVAKKAEFDGHVSAGIVSSNEITATMGPADFSTELGK